MIILDKEFVTKKSYIVLVNSILVYAQTFGKGYDEDSFSGF